MNEIRNENPVPSYRLYRERSGESGDFWLHCETIPERTHLHNWEIAVHRHDAFFQIFLLTAGHGELVGGKRDAGTRQFGAPCAIFIPPGVAHGFRFSRDIDGLVVTALADRLASLAAADRAIAAHVAETRITPLDDRRRDAAAVAESVHRIQDEIRGRAPARAVLLEAVMTEALVCLARAGAGSAGVSPDVSTRDQLRVAELETLIGAHFREHRPVDFYAARIGISAAHLNRVARALTGASVQELVARRLLEAARRDLVFTPTAVQAIAFSLGFSDPAYFNRFFRRMTGTTPGAFRRAERGRLAG